MFTYPNFEGDWRPDRAIGRAPVGTYDSRSHIMSIMSVFVGVLSNPSAREVKHWFDHVLNPQRRVSRKRRNKNGNDHPAYRSHYCRVAICVHYRSLLWSQIISSIIIVISIILIITDSIITIPKYHQFVYRKGIVLISCWLHSWVSFSYCKQYHYYCKYYKQSHSVIFSTIIQTSDCNDNNRVHHSGYSGYPLHLFRLHYCYGSQVTCPGQRNLSQPPLWANDQDGVLQPIGASGGASQASKLIIFIGMPWDAHVVHMLFIDACKYIYICVCETYI